MHYFNLQDMVNDAPGSQAALRRANSALVLRSLAQVGPSSQAELSRATGLSRASVTNIVRQLEADGQVRTWEDVRGGRRARVVERVVPAKLLAAVCIGRNDVRITLADLNLEVLAETEAHSVEELTPTACLDDVATRLEQLLASIERDRSDLLGAVVGVPAPIDVRTGTLGSGALMRDWVGVNLREELETRLDVPVTVENDANLGALGEFRSGGYEPGTENLIYVRITTGIGAGIVLGGRLHRGASGVAGEIGHTSLDPAGPLCRCGNRGCLEVYAVAPVVLDVERTDIPSLRSTDDVIRLAIDGEITSLRIVEDMAGRLGVAVANLCNTLNPDVVVFSGPITALGDLLLDPVRREVERRSVPSAAGAVRVTPARLGTGAEALGALAIAFDRYAANLLAFTS